MSAHTPGPWKVKRVSDDFDSKHVILMDDARRTYPGRYTTMHVVEYDHGCEPRSNGWKEAVANARLIAAAPDLLEAARHAMSCDFPDSIDFRCEGCNAARASIAKAEGRDA